MSGKRAFFGTQNANSKQQAKQLIDASRDHKAGLFLVQRISIAIQCGNAVSLLGTLPASNNAEECFHFK